MSSQRRHNDPLSPLLDAITERICERMEELLSQQKTDSDLAEVIEKTDFDPLRSYDAEEAAKILGVEKRTLYDIPRHELPVDQVGAARGKLVYLGLNLMLYRAGLEPIDLKPYLQDLRDSYHSPRTSAQSTTPNGARRQGMRRVL